MKKKMIALDLDGTLLNNESQLSDYTIDVIQKVKKEFEDIEYDIDTCDEWVNIYISITEPRN